MSTLTRLHDEEAEKRKIALADEEKAFINEKRNFVLSLINEANLRRKPENRIQAKSFDTLAKLEALALGGKVNFKYPEELGEFIPKEGNTRSNSLEKASAGGDGFSEDFVNQKANELIDGISSDQSLDGKPEENLELAISAASKKAVELQDAYNIANEGLNTVAAALGIPNVEDLSVAKLSKEILTAATAVVKANADAKKDFDKKVEAAVDLKLKEAAKEQKNTATGTGAKK